MSHIEHEMVRVGRIIAADQALQVHVRGTMAFATPGHVTIPNIDHYTWLGARDGYRMLHGLLDHECAHALYTDFTALKDWRVKDKPCPALVELQNILEDAYIESLMGRRYVGSASNIRLMNEWFLVRENPGASTPSGIALVRDGDLWSATMVALGAVANEHGHRTIEAFKPIRPEVYRLLKLVESELAEVAGLTAPLATADVIRLALRIFDKLRTAVESKPEPKPEPKPGAKGEKKPRAEKPEHEPAPGADEEGEEDEPGDEPEEADDESDEGDADDDASEDSEDGDDDSDGAADGDDESEDGDAGGEEGTDGDAEEGEGAEASTAEGKKESAAEPDGGEESKPTVEIMDIERWTVRAPLRPVDAIHVIVRSVFEQPTTTQPYTNFSHEFDIERDFTGDRHDALSASYEHAKLAAREVSDSLVFAFEAGLRSRDQKRPIGGHDEGEVDSQGLVEYAVGALPIDQLYVQHVDDDATNVAVAVLCDCSGSMSGRKAALCQQAAIAMHSALSQVQIEHEITGFTTIESGSVRNHPWARAHIDEYNANFLRMRAALVEAEERGTRVDLFARELPHGHQHVGRADLLVPIHAVFKRFGDSDARALMHIAGISQNLDGEAILWQAQRIARRPEKRKVMFVITDGYPVGSRDNAQGSRYLKETIDRVMAAGIEIYGIGIESDHGANFYPLWWHCKSASDLIRVAVESLADVLIKRRVESDVVSL